MRKVFQRKLPIGSGSMSACRVSNIHHTHFSQSPTVNFYLTRHVTWGVFLFPLTSLTSRWERSGWAAASGLQTVPEQTGLRWAHRYEAALQLPGALPGHRQGEVRGQECFKRKVSYFLLSSILKKRCAVPTDLYKWLDYSLRSNLPAGGEATGIVRVPYRIIYLQPKYWPIYWPICSASVGHDYFLGYMYANCYL